MLPIAELLGCLLLSNANPATRSYCTFAIEEWFGFVGVSCRTKVRHWESEYRLGCVAGVGEVLKPPWLCSGFYRCGVGFETEMVMSPRTLGTVCSVEVG